MALILLTGCLNPSQIDKEVTVLAPEDALIQDCIPAPYDTPIVWGDYPPIVVKLEAALEICNDRMLKNRQWKENAIKEAKAR